MWKLWTSDTWPEWTSMPHSVKLAGAVVIGGATLVLVVRQITSIASQKKVYPKDTVILHQIGRGPWAPSLSPFAVKLETYLRMAKIPYQNDDEVKPGPKGKIPWIEYNGEIVSDSQFSIEFLNKQFNQDLNKNYTAEQIAIGRAFQKMLEENTFWAAALFRFCYDEGDFWSCKEAPFSRDPLTVYMIKRTIRQYTHAHGIGRHSKEDVKKILVEDMNALSTFLGKKKFLLGDTPSEVDCAVFGLLSNMRWHSFGNSIKSLMEDLPNLCDYCERMKTTFWPDWDDCITHGSTTVPTR